MEQFKLFFISCWIWIGPWGLLLKCASGLLKDEFVFVIFILFYFVCFFFSLCHIFEYFNNFVLDHWLFAFIFQNSVYVNCPLEGQVGISFHLSCFFFFANFFWPTLQKKKTTTHFVYMDLSYFLCLPPNIYDVLWRKHDGCLTMDTTASRFHDCFVCRILLSLLRCQFWNFSARTCVCVCVSHVKHLLRQLLPQATTNLPPLPLHSPKCELLWLLTTHSSRARLKWPMPHATQNRAPSKHTHTTFKMKRR